MVSTNLLANIVQKSKDKSDAKVAQILEAEVSATPELKAELDAMLEKLDVIQEAEKSLSETDKEWFANTIQQELQKIHSGIKYEAVNIGSGAIAQGPGAIAVCAGGTHVGGDLH